MKDTPKPAQPFPTYRVTSSKQLDNGETLIRCVTEDGKRIVKRVRPQQGGGVMRFAINERSSAPLDLVVTPSSFTTSSALVVTFPFRVSAATRLCEVISLAENIPRLRVVWPAPQEDVQTVHEHLNAAD